MNQTVTRLLAAATAAVLVCACNYHGAIVMNDNVVGPQGERLYELQCDQASGCMSQARYLCGGDFYVVSSSSNGTLVGCKATPDGGAPPR
jgi:hypothetical protein